MSSILTVFFILVGIWAALIAFLMVPDGAISSLWDKVTKSRGRDDKVQLQIMLDHLKSFKDEWYITTDSASFPKKGAKEIYIDYDRDKKEWRYTLNSFDSKPRPLDGYFGPQFIEEIKSLNRQRESTALLRNFYPDLDTGTLLLK